MENNILHIPQMLLIGSSGRNSGKTTLAIEMIKEWKDKYKIIGLKVTTIQERDGKCPRGGEGCGVCSSLKGNFEVLEETRLNANKDTSLLLSAGAEKVYWIKTLKTNITESIEEFMSGIPKDTIIICESNSLRNVVKPGIFIMLNNRGNAPVKKSASEVMHMADMIIDYDFRDKFNTILDKIQFNSDNSNILIKLNYGNQ